MSAEPDGQNVVLGFVESLDLPSAAIHAATELVQMEFSLSVVTTMSSSAGNWVEWCQKVTTDLPPLCSSLGLDAPLASTSTPLSLSLSTLLESVSKRIDLVWFADMTRSTIDLPSVRAVSPMLYHTKPRFAYPRSKSSPVQDPLLSAEFQRPGSPSRVIWFQTLEPMGLSTTI